MKVCNAYNLFICPTTYQGLWVDWELKKSLELDKPLMGGSLYNDGCTHYYPEPLKDWPRQTWNVANIVRAMKQLATISQMNSVYI